MTGLAQEVAQFKANRGQAPAPETATTTADAAAAEHFNTAVELPKPPAQAALEPKAAVASPVAPVPPAPAAPAAPQTKIVINGQTFDTIEAATSYANDLAATMAQQDAYIQGMNTNRPQAQAAVEAVATKSLDELVEEKLFEDPKAAVKMLREGLTKEIVQTQAQQQVAQANVKQMWDNFYETNQDLSGKESRELVDFTLQKNWNTLKDMPLPQASKLLAAETRKLAGKLKQEMSPGQELPSTPAVVNGASGAPVATPAAEGYEAIDFTTQVRNLKNRKAK